MKLKTAVLAALLACAATHLLAAEEEETFTLIINQGWGSGQWFLSLSKGQQAAMAAGFVSGLFMSPLMGAPERGAGITAISECTTGMTTVQLGAIVEKYLRDHPEKWNHAIAFSAVDAFQNACPAFDAAMKLPRPSYGRPTAPPAPPPAPKAVKE